MFSIFHYSSKWWHNYNKKINWMYTFRDPNCAHYSIKSELSWPIGSQKYNFTWSHLASLNLWIPLNPKSETKNAIGFHWYNKYLNFYIYVMGCYGVLWGCYGMVWGVTGKLWDIMGCYVALGKGFAGFGVIWRVMGCYGAIMGCYGAVMGYYGVSWGSYGPPQTPPTPQTLIRNFQIL